MWDLAEHAGYGFSDLKIENINSQKPNFKKDAIVKYKQCRLMKLIHPHFVDIALDDCISVNQWKDLRDSDSVTLYHLISILSEYDLYIKKDLRNLIEPKSFQEKENLINHLFLKDYLKLFSATNKKIHPLTSEEIHNLVDKFLSMVKIDLILKKKNKRPSKFDAKAFIRKHIQDYLGNAPKKEELEKLVKNKSNHDMFTEI